MNKNLNNAMQSQLKNQDSLINERLAELELKLLMQKDDIQSEINEYLKKQEDIAKTIEYLDTLQEIKDDTESQIIRMKKAEKARERKYKMIRKSHLESWIMDYKQGALRTQGTSTHDSYLDTVHYYQKQLSSLISSLSS